MTVAATLPNTIDDAITGVFERTINETRIFWAQRRDGSLVCADWDWCCPEVPAILGGLDAVVFVTRSASRVRVAPKEVLVVSLDARRVWGRWRLVVDRAPQGVATVTWDDSYEVRI
jgi:hypothetical protein